MNKAHFIQHLRATAEELKPLSEAVTSGGLTWNGTEYVKGEEKRPEPYALAWSSILTTIADLLETQETPLSDKQLAYLKRLLFGGMGSLNDLYFDPKIVGEIANDVNDRLNRSRKALFASFGV